MSIYNNNRYERNIIINRAILFAFSIIAVPVTILQGMFGAFDNNGNGVLDSFTHLFKGELVYFTVISNILVFTWALFAFINIFKKNERLNNVLENQLIKGTTFLFILITGVIFNSLLIWDEAKDIQSYKGVAELIKNLLGRSFIEHFMVPIFMVSDMILTKGYKVKRKEEAKERVCTLLISMIFPLLYLFISLILIKFEVIPPQYFFMDFFNTTSEPSNIMVNSIIIVGVSLMWILLWLLMQYLSNLKFKNDKNWTSNSKNQQVQIKKAKARLLLKVKKKK